MTLELQLISFFTVLIISIKDQLSLILYIRNINRNIFDKNDLKITEILLYGDSLLDDKNNILNAIIDSLGDCIFFVYPCKCLI